MPPENRAQAGNPSYQRYHPRWHRRNMPIFWWLGRASYVKFILRELTSLAVGYVAVLLVLEVCAVGRGPAAHAAFRAALASPGLVVLHAIVMAGLLFHTVTWLNLAPQALVLRVAGHRLPDWVVVAGHYAAWLGTCGLVWWWFGGR